MMSSEEYRKQFSNSQDAKVSKPKAKRAIKHLESEMQQDCIKHFKKYYPKYEGLLISIPNGVTAGGKLKKMPDGKMVPVSALIAKGEGKVAGASDLFFFVARGKYHGLCLEAKTPKGKMSPAQHLFKERVEKQGYMYAIFHSVFEFQTILETYLNVK